jgi:Uma2 family endonuclease
MNKICIIMIEARSMPPVNVALPKVEQKKETVVKVMKAPRRVSLATFFSRYAHAEDGHKYEYINGFIEKTKRITKEQWYIVDNLESRFVQTTAYQQGNRLFNEPEIWTSEAQVRAPDLAYLTKAQIRKESSEEKTLSPFLIEVVSKTDRFYKVNAKLREYFKAGVAVVWLVLPESEEVYVYTSPTQVQVCVENTKCFAGDFLPDFDISAGEIFKR